MLIYMLNFIGTHLKVHCHQAVYTLHAQLPTMSMFSLQDLHHPPISHGNWYKVSADQVTPFPLHLAVSWYRINEY